jgi:hypothetical protein
MGVLIDVKVNDKLKPQNGMEVEKEKKIMTASGNVVSAN